MEKKMSKEEIIENLRKAKDEGLYPVIKVRTRNNETVMVPMAVPDPKMATLSNKAKCETNWVLYALDVESFDRAVKYTKVTDEKGNQIITAERYLIKNIEYVYLCNDVSKDEEE